MQYIFLILIYSVCLFFNIRSILHLRLSRKQSPEHYQSNKKMWHLFNGANWAIAVGSSAAILSCAYKLLV